MRYDLISIFIWWLGAVVSAIFGVAVGVYIEGWFKLLGLVNDTNEDLVIALWGLCGVILWSLVWYCKFLPWYNR